MISDKSSLVMTHKAALFGVLFDCPRQCLQQLRHLRIRQDLHQKLWINAGEFRPAFKKMASIFLALFFHNFSTFLGRAGIYLEDLFVLPEYRGKGYFWRRIMQEEV